MKIIFDHSHGHVIDNRVFCEAFVLPEGESEDFLLEHGWLPSVQPPIYWYQSQSIRIDSEKMVLNRKQRNTFSNVCCEIFDYERQSEVDSFFLDFFVRKDLKLQEFYRKNSEFFKLKVMSVSLENEIVAYTRFVQFENSILGVESSYKPKLPKHSLGINSILLLANYGKSQNIRHTYIYEAYKDTFPHKFNITGSEFWEGEKWISTDI